MTRALRWIGLAAGGLAGLAIVAYGVGYVVSESALRRVYAVPAVTLSIPADPESITEGRRLATVHGCLAGCHGKEGGGAVFFDDPKLGRLVAPDLTAAARKFSAAQLAAVIRNGVRPDGRSVLVMPSEAYVGLNDADLARIIAFLQSLPAASGPGPDLSLGPLARVGLAAGKFKVAAQLIADTVPPPEGTDEISRRGRYLARTTCAGCHGTSLRGDSNPDFTSPDLRVVSAYSPEAFTRLLRTGVPPGDRKLGMMREVALHNLSHLSDAEISALHRYLHALPQIVRN